MYDYKTSYPAYKEPGKDQCRGIVLAAVRTLGECNDKQIAAYLNWPINRVTPRRGELFIAGIVERSERRKNEDGRLVNWWRIKKQVVQTTLF